MVSCSFKSACFKMKYTIAKKFDFQTIVLIIKDLVGTHWIQFSLSTLKVFPLYLPAAPPPPSTQLTCAQLPLSTCNQPSICRQPTNLALLHLPPASSQPSVLAACESPLWYRTPACPDPAISHCVIDLCVCVPELQQTFKISIGSESFLLIHHLLHIHLLQTGFD